jgi:hypothetical protein
MWHSPREEAFLPSRGHAIVTITVLDENGFTHHYAPVELRLDVLTHVIPTFSAPAEDHARSPRAMRSRRLRDRW